MCSAEFLVCVLSVLVTALIGFNVWSAINVKEMITKISEESDEKINRMLDEFKDLEQRINERLVRQRQLNNEHFDNQARAIEQLSRTTMMSRAQIEEDFAVMLAFMPESDSYPQLIPHSIRAMDVWAALREYEKAKACVAFLKKYKQGAELFKVTKEEKQRWMSLLIGVPNQDEIQDIQEIYNLLLRLGEEYNNTKE